MRRITRTRLIVLAGGLGLALLAAPTVAHAELTDALPDAGFTARDAQPVVLTGAQLPAWSRLPAEGTPTDNPPGELSAVRDAHKDGKRVVLMRLKSDETTKFVAVPIARA